MENRLMDMSQARTAMVDSQVRTNDVTDRRLIHAMLSVPREIYVPAAKAGLAYVEQMIETLPGRTLWTARDFSKLLQAAAVTETDHVLDIAPGTGYSSAVLARIAGKVTALEEEASAHDLRKLALANASIRVVTGSLKAPVQGGPFDVIFVNGAVEEIPPAWTDQLAEGGRLAVVTVEGGVRRGCIITRSGGKTAKRIVFDATAPRLPGFEAAATFRL